MIKQKNIRVVVSLLLVCTLYVACNRSTDGRSPCLEPRRYFVKIQTLLPADTGSAGVAYPLPAGHIGYVDTPIRFYNGANISDFSGPLSAVADSTRWFIGPDTTYRGALDTLTFYYQRKPVFVSTACGYAMVYSLTHVNSTHYYIDSARIEKTEVTNATDVAHVKVFY